MSNILLNITNGDLIPNVCFPTEQQRLNAFAALMQAVLPGQTFFNVGDSKPSVSNQAYPWFRTVDGRWYYFSGQWKAPVPSWDASERRWYAGLIAGIATYDGGDATPAGPEGGPMWTEDTDFIGRSPMHPGLIPETTSSFAKTLLVGANYGDGSHAQSLTELAVHNHKPDPKLADTFLGHAAAGSAATYNIASGGDTIGMFATDYAGGNGLTPSVTQPMSLVQPVRGLYCIKRTTRVFYTVP